MQRDLELNQSLANLVTAKLVEAGYAENPRKQYTSFSRGRGDKTYLHFSLNVIRATRHTDGEVIIRGYFAEPNGRASETQDEKYSTWFFNGYVGRAGTRL